MYEHVNFVISLGSYLALHQCSLLARLIALGLAASYITDLPIVLASTSDLCKLPEKLEAAE